MDWFVHDFLPEAVVAILAALGAAVLGILREKEWRWANAVLYGLVCFVCIMLVLVAIEVHYALPSKTAPITPDNVETYVRQWVAALGYGNRTVEDTQSRFHLAVTLPNGNVISIRQPKRVAYLAIEISVGLSPEQQNIFNQLPVAEAQSLMHDLRIELARFSVGYRNIEMPLRVVPLQVEIPITSDMSDTTLHDALKQVDFARILTSERILKSLETSGHEKRKR